jgi:hypothetical protein
MDIVLGQSASHLTVEQTMFLRHLFQIKEMWSQAFIGRGEDASHKSLDLGVTCLARAGSLNEIIATKLYSRASVFELFKLV